MIPNTYLEEQLALLIKYYGKEDVDAALAKADTPSRTKKKIKDLDFTTRALITHAATRQNILSCSLGNGRSFGTPKLFVTMGGDTVDIQVSQDQFNKLMRIGISQQG